jgi:hypothetical protein
MTQQRSPVTWPGTSSTNFEDDLHNAVPEPSPLPGQTCPLCGNNKPHEHTAQEVIIFRNGVKRGRASA